VGGGERTPRVGKGAGLAGCLVCKVEGLTHP
jgi:hypothetical protein